MVLDNVKGVVEAVGIKFNGSLLIGGAWYNLKKGTTLPDNLKGKEVVLKLESWEFKGKSGVNVSNIEVVTHSKTTPELKSKNLIQEFFGEEGNELKQKVSGPQATNWAAKDRSQLVGGRSHDAAELAKVSIQTGTPMKQVLAAYAEALEGILKLAEEVK